MNEVIGAESQICQPDTASRYLAVQRKLERAEVLFAYIVRFQILIESGCH